LYAYIFIPIHENLDLIQMPQIILSRSLTLVYAKHNGAVVMGDFGVYRNQVYNWLMFNMTPQNFQDIFWCEEGGEDCDFYI
jgi:hypothetical protein